MTRIEYQEWLARERVMRRDARDILRYFDTDRLSRKPRSGSQQLRPSRHSRTPPVDDAVD